MEINKFFPMLCIFSTLSVLSGCGDGGSSGDGNRSNSDIGQVPDDFDLMEQSGTWRMSVVTRTNLNNDINIGDISVNVQGTIDSTQLSIKSWDVNDSEVIESSCSASAPEIIVSNDFDSNQLDGGYDDLGFSDCVTENMDYIRVNDSHYRMEYSCDDFFSYTIDFIKLYDQPEFNFGNLSFTSSLYDDLNTNVGVCGTLTKLRDVGFFSPQPNELGWEDHNKNIESFMVMSPYNGNRISIDFKFVSDIRVGSYSIVDTASADNEVEVVLSSETFGGTPDNPGFIYAESGIVNIISISKYSVTGNFEISTSILNTMSGSFSFDIE